jgi:putative flippase GtrA
MTFLGRDVIRFGIVGSLAFLIDATVLAALVHGAAWSPFAARAAAIATAILCTWRLHRYWTFPAGRARSPLPQSLLYGTFQLLTVSLNYSVFSVLVLTGGVWRTYPVLAAAAGSLTAMGFSYLLSKRVTFAEPGAPTKLVGTWRGLDDLRRGDLRRGDLSPGDSRQGEPSPAED